MQHRPTSPISPVGRRAPRAFSTQAYFQRFLATGQLRWRRFVRFGVKLPSGRVSARYILLAWLCVLMSISLLLWVTSLATRPLLGIGSVSFPSDSDVDSNTFWTRRHLIFAVSGGRSGSGYLSSVLGCAEGVVSLHEPLPKMNGDDLEAVLIHGHRRETLADRRDRKMRAIRDTLLGTQSNVVYAETSHMFIKTFADAVLLELAELENTRVTILIAARHPADVVLSQLRLGWFSANHSGRNVWYYSPLDLDPTERKVNTSSFSSSDPLSEAILYNADIHQRQLEIMQLVEEMHNRGRWMGVSVESVVLEDIRPKNRSAIAHFLTNLGLTPLDDRIQALEYQDGNRRDMKKIVADVQVDEALVYAQVNKTWKELFSGLK